MIENVRDHAANESTDLAWIRTTLSLMVFGFVVERFDLTGSGRPSSNQASMTFGLEREVSCRSAPFYRGRPHPIGGEAAA